MIAREALAKAYEHLEGLLNNLDKCVQAMVEDDLRAVSAAKAAELLDCSVRTVNRMCEDGRLYKVDGKIPCKAIRAYLSRERHPTHTNLK
jgi:hypothetical protein